ncbi:MAG: methyltransferase domain-containing protein [Actinomycetes bacterium]
MTGATHLPESVGASIGEPAATESDALRLVRDAQVRQGFAQLEVLERLDPVEAGALVAEHLQAHRDHAVATLRPLDPPPRVRGNYHKIIASPANRTKLSRVLDVVMPGDRVLEIGLGYGYLACLLLRDAGVGSYVGLDLTKHRITVTKALAEANGLAGVPMLFEIGDLYDLTPARVAEHDPDLLLVLEVLDHVPDAERALATLARCMRPDAAILFSVPVLGRLEKLWGHVSLFDSARVRAMCMQAGLVIQHIEVVQNSWTFVLATPTAAVPARLLHLLRRPLPTAPPAAVVKPTFTEVDLTQVAGIGSSTVAVGERRVSATVQQRGSRWQPRLRRRQAAVGGLRFPVAGDARLRLELEFDKPRRVRRVFVILRDVRDQESVRWVWHCSEGRGPKPGRRVYVLRPGRKIGRFAPVGEERTGVSRTAEIVIKLAPGASAATLTLYRAAAAQDAAED